MATYTITIREKTKAGKAVLSLLQSLNDIVIIQPSGIDESLTDIQEGRVYFAENTKDLMNQRSK